MENVSFWFEIIVAILTGIAACIPLVIKLVQVIKDSVKAKNWTPLLQLVLKLMTEAEDNYASGAEKKKYVMDSIEALKSSLNYDVDMNAVSEMIDAIIRTTKRINVNKK